MSELDNIVKNYLDIRHELESFSEALAKKEELILLSKADLFDKEMIDFVKKELEKTVKNRKIMVISAGAFMGIDELKDYLIDQYASNLPVQTPDSDMVDATRVYDLKDRKEANDYKLIYK
jgi:GTP-binding protein